MFYKFKIESKCGLSTIIVKSVVEKFIFHFYKVNFSPLIGAIFIKFFFFRKSQSNEETVRSAKDQFNLETACERIVWQYNKNPPYHFCETGLVYETNMYRPRLKKIEKNNPCRGKTFIAGYCSSYRKLQGGFLSWPIFFIEGAMQIAQE